MTKCACTEGARCAQHANLASLDDLCTCSHRRGVHQDPRHGGTQCLTTGACKAECKTYVAVDEFDIIQKARHYNSHPSGVEAIDVCRHLTGDWFNAFKYVFRADHKNGRQDIQKALYYAKDAIFHGIRIRAASWASYHSELLMKIMDAEPDSLKYAFFNSIMLESPSSAKQCIERILQTWPSDA